MKNKSLSTFENHAQEVSKFPPTVGQTQIHKDHVKKTLNLSFEYFKYRNEAYSQTYDIAKDREADRVLVALSEHVNPGSTAYVSSPTGREHFRALWFGLICDYIEMEIQKIIWKSMTAVERMDCRRVEQNSNDRLNILFSEIDRVKSGRKPKIIHELYQ